MDRKSIFPGGSILARRDGCHRYRECSIQIIADYQLRSLHRDLTGAYRLLSRKPTRFRGLIPTTVLIAIGVRISYCGCDDKSSMKNNSSWNMTLPAHSNQFQMLVFTSELSCARTHFQDFSFTSPCACPGACDDDGVIGATQPPGIDVCEIVDSCT